MGVIFPPKATKPNYQRDARIMSDGEPNIVPLVNYDNERSTRGADWVICCGCGLRHLMSYEVFTTPDKKFHLVARAYADERTRPKARRPRTRKK